MARCSCSTRENPVEQFSCLTSLRASDMCLRAHRSELNCVDEGNVAKTLTDSNGSRTMLYAYPVQPKSEAGFEQVSQLPTVVMTSSTTAAGHQPPVAIIQTALSGDLPLVHRN